MQTTFILLVLLLVALLGLLALLTTGFFDKKPRPIVTTLVPGFAEKGGGGNKGGSGDRQERCLCVFDNDRTLTAKQVVAPGECPGAEIYAPAVHDPAYGGGPYRPAAALSLLRQGPCGQCLGAVISAGNPSSPEEKKHVLANLPAGSLEGALRWGAVDGRKETLVPEIQKIYETTYAVHIPDEKVFFFDDRRENVQPFAATSFNARQVSCEARDLEGAIGYCGASLGEITLDTGVRLC